MAEEEKNDLNLGENERVGDYLRRIREIRGLDLDHLAKSIRLGKSILQAIEDNNWNYFPTEAYLRSYIVSLCEKLSLDKTIVLKKFSAETNSQFGIIQANVVSEQNHEKDSSASSPSGVPKAAIIIVLAILVILFFASKILNGYSKEGEDESDMEEFQKTEEFEILEESFPDSLSKNDSDPVSKVADVATVPVPVSTSDTLRFECSPSATDSTCGVSLKGWDTKMSYFKKMTNRYINRSDTVQVTVTVPGRTKLFLNNAKLEYGQFNTLLFYNGNVVNKINRDLR